MSRIEEALKRARGAGDGESTVGMPVAGVTEEKPSTLPTPDVFRDAWALAEPEDERPVRGAGPSFAPMSSPAVPAHQNVSGGGRKGVEPRPETTAGGSPGADNGASGEADVRGLPSTPARAGATGSPAEQEPTAGGGEHSVVPGLALFHGFDPAVAEKIVAMPDIRPAFVEQYRKLAGALHHAQLEKNTKVVMVTSATAGEGKTLTSTNLALTFSESYRRSVLLIDADLRRPTLHEMFQVPNVSGLGDGLRAEEEQKLSLVQVSPRLTLLTAGRPDPDPMSGLTSIRMRRVIEEAVSRFDWVVIDTPPVGLLPDAKLLAEMADATLLVIRAGKTPYPLVRRAVEIIGRSRVFGVVLNRAEDSLGTNWYSYYTYYDSYAKAK